MIAPIDPTMKYWNRRLLLLAFLLLYLLKSGIWLVLALLALALKGLSKAGALTPDSPEAFFCVVVLSARTLPTVRGAARNSARELWVRDAMS